VHARGSECRNVRFSGSGRSTERGAFNKRDARSPRALILLPVKTGTAADETSSDSLSPRMRSDIVAEVRLFSIAGQLIASPRGMLPPTPAGTPQRRYEKNDFGRSSSLGAQPAAGGRRPVAASRTIFIVVVLPDPRLPLVTTKPGRSGNRTRSITVNASAI